jgi:uncharacterized protein (TIRG00374 family)
LKRSTLLQVIGGLLLAGTGLYVFFRGVKPHELLAQILLIPFWAIAGCVVLTVATLWLRSIRWNLILPAHAGASRKDLFGLVMISFMINNFVPARLGEAVRMVLLWKRNKFSAAESVGSVVLERFLDIIVFLSFFFIPAFFMPALRTVLPFALPMAIGTGGILVVLVLYALFPLKVRSLCVTFVALVPKNIQGRVIAVGTELVSNFDWIFSAWKCLVIALLSVAIVFCHTAMMMILAHSSAFSLLAGMFGAAAAAIGAAIPLSPGYVGTLHAALKQGLMLTGLPEGPAAAVATVYHAIGYCTVTLFGLIFFVKMRISFQDIGSAKKQLNVEKN